MWRWCFLLEPKRVRGVRFGYGVVFAILIYLVGPGYLQGDDDPARYS